MILKILGLLTQPLSYVLSNTVQALSGSSSSQKDPISDLKTQFTQLGLEKSTVDVAISAINSGKLSAPFATNLAEQLKTGAISVTFAQGIVNGIDSGKLSAPLATNLYLIRSPQAKYQLS